ncbi:MAG TPA: RNA 2',3'-cyclic phosphodiesterase [Candidatus Bathyarchaeia archaeon]|nr:RNA 2',3'-cyclic phosphodiesterase [Candidatus Bathyarchaeia archaeon]
MSSSKSETIRCFISLNLDHKTQTALADLQRTLKKNGALARWVKPENIHLTLRFLGYRDPKRVKEIAQALPGFFSNMAGFPLTINFLQAFPNEKKPRVLWAGISKSNDEAIGIFEQVNNGLAKLGIPKDQEEFVPHLTLARCKTPEESRSVSEAIKKAPKFSIEAQATQITFYQSTLSSDGPIYQSLATVTLN